MNTRATSPATTPPPAPGLWLLSGLIQPTFAQFWLASLPCATHTYTVCSVNNMAYCCPYWACRQPVSVCVCPCVCLCLLLWLCNDGHIGHVWVAFLFARLWQRLMHMFSEQISPAIAIALKRAHTERQTERRKRMSRSRSSSSSSAWLSSCVCTDRAICSYSYTQQFPQAHFANLLDSNSFTSQRHIRMQSTSPWTTLEMEMVQLSIRCADVPAGVGIKSAQE